MSDPLGLINSGGIGPARWGGATPRPPGGPGEGPSFKDVLLENIRQADRMQQDANRAIEDLQTGRRDDVEGVILATQKADMAFRMLQSVRNRMMEAYDEIRQIRV
ncbi:MAG: flagellar hook-basal body complex protein FliE [Phycisphaerae bacterium]|nr:flagellar hook-basal body complex protein FliE [Phycisphaerae bacterium]